MTHEEFRTACPLLLNWIQKTLQSFSQFAFPVSALGFRRLSQYYGNSTLIQARVVVASKVPVPPLSALGLARFSEFEHLPFIGITYLNTYFLRSDEANNESLHFHELVHIVQWRELGPEEFLLRYMDGLERYKYRNSPLEAVAYDLQHRFETMPTTFDAEVEIVRSLQSPR